MNIRTAIIAGAIAPLLMAGSAFAQTTTGTGTSLGVSSMPVTSSVSAGSAVPLGTVTLTSPGGSFTLNSLPVIFTAGNGGLSSNLSSCQVSNNGTTLTQSGSSTPMIVSGSNSWAFTTPLTVTSAAPVTLQIRCDVASSTVSGSTFS